MNWREVIVAGYLVGGAGGFVALINLMGWSAARWPAIERHVGPIGTIVLMVWIALCMRLGALLGIL